MLTLLNSDASDLPLETASSCQMSASSGTRSQAGHIEDVLEFSSTSK